MFRRKNTQDSGKQDESVAQYWDHIEPGYEVWDSNHQAIGTVLQTDSDGLVVEFGTIGRRRLPKTGVHAIMLAFPSPNGGVLVQGSVHVSPTEHELGATLGA